jgi:myo-inositol-1(or 4)-monophosphatase
MLVFISYPGNEKALAEQVAAICRGHGHEAFIAEESARVLMGSAGWKTALFATIDRCDAFVLCLNEHSLEGQWQRMEWDHALGQRERPFVVARHKDDTLYRQLGSRFVGCGDIQWCYLDVPQDRDAIDQYFKDRGPGTDEDRFQWMQDVVVDAGLLLTKRYGVGRQSSPPVLLDESKNCATNFDEDIEHFMLKALANRYPGQPVLAEESIEKSHQTWKGDANAEWIWTVDAIDGTLNFLAGDDRYCCGIGLLHRGQPYFGAIYLPAQMLLFAGGVGRPATVRSLRDGTVHILQADQEMKDLGKCWTLTHINSKADEIACGFEHDLPRRLHDAVRRVWMWGCGLISLTALARGTHHLFAQRVIWPWDIVPGLALVHAAGAKSTVWPAPEAKPWAFTGVLKSDVIVACNAEILQAAVATFATPKDVDCGSTSSQSESRKKRTR